MARIKIKDLPKDMKISRKELRLISGGDGGTAAFPDVCITPTSGGSTPIPYPETKSSGDTKDATSIQTYNLTDFSAFILPALND